MLQLTIKLMNMFNYSITTYFIFSNKVTIPVVIFTQFTKRTLGTIGKLMLIAKC